MKNFFLRNILFYLENISSIFVTSAQDDNGASGGVSKVNDNIKRDSTQKNLDIKNFKSLWDGDFFNSYGIFDRDGSQFDNNLLKYSENCHKVLKRYTIENYIFKSLKFKELKTKLDNLNKIIGSSNNQIQNIIDDIFKSIFKELNFNNEVKKYFKIKLEQIKDFIRAIKKYKSGKNDNFQ